MELKYLMIGFLVAHIKLLFPTTMLQAIFKTSRQKYGQYINESIITWKQVEIIVAKREIAPFITLLSNIVCF